MMDLSNVNITNYVVTNNELIEINPEIISLSKNLSQIKEKIKK